MLCIAMCCTLLYTAHARYFYIVPVVAGERHFNALRHVDALRDAVLRTLRRVQYRLSRAVRISVLRSTNAAVPWYKSVCTGRTMVQKRYTRVHSRARRA
eukprot:3940693-Rhodomonas_salina.1